VTASGATVRVPVRIPTALRQLTGGERTVLVEIEPPPGADGAVTVGAVLDALAIAHAPLERRVRDELGQARVHVNLFVGSDNIRDLDGLATPVGQGQELSIIPAISGG
jgi:molybdopterin converting factor small subunit